MESMTPMKTQEFSYTFFLNNTFDPMREYCPISDGYRPGAIVENVHMGEVVAIDHLHACSKLFETFNIDHPADYKKRSMSVGDVIMLTNGVTMRFFAVDKVGFKEVGDPTMQIPSPDYVTMDVYFQYRDIYEIFRRQETPVLFLVYLKTLAASEDLFRRRKGVN